MSHADEMQRCLEAGDVAGVRRLWAHVRPGMPQPKTDTEARIILHMARTQSIVCSFAARAYSHRWLLDNGYPSQLPDNLKPKAERLYPAIHEAVGLAIGAKNILGRAMKPHIEGAMIYAINEVYADHKRPFAPTVKKRMLEAREKITKKLLGVISTGMAEK